MKRIAVFGFAALLAGVSVAQAEDDIVAEAKQNCGAAPHGEQVLDGKTATKAEMDAANTQIIGFLAASDFYQDCLARTALAKKEKLTPAEKQKILNMIDSSQREKEEIGAAYNASVDAFNAAHPVTPKPAPAAKTP